MVATIVGKICFTMRSEFAGKRRPPGAYGEHFTAPAPSPVDAELSLSTWFWRLRFLFRLLSGSVELRISEEAGSIAPVQENEGRLGPTWTLLRRPPPVP